jgi:hypothetical protein
MRHAPFGRRRIGSLELLRPQMSKVSYSFPSNASIYRVLTFQDVQIRFVLNTRKLF